MGKGRQQVTDKLRKLSEDLETISVRDRGVWGKLAAKIHKTAAAGGVS